MDSLLRPGDPHPNGFDQVKIGMKLSQLMAVFPEAEYSASWSTYNRRLASGPFDLIRYGFLTSLDQTDPEITGIEFFFRDSTYVRPIRQAALDAFGAEGVESRMLGQVLEWRSVDSTRIHIDNLRYSISRMR
jgi:hypothetical protein